MSGLGIKLEQIIFYIFCFIITMIILDNFLFKKIVEILNKREAEIERALSEKDAVQEKLAHINFEAEKIIHDAKENARLTLEEARASIEPEKHRLLELAKQESEQIVSEARRKGEDVIVTARLKSQEEAVTLLKAIMAKAMAKFEITTESQNQVLANIINTKL